MVALKKIIKEYRKLIEGPGQVNKKRAKALQKTWLRAVLVVNFLKRLNLYFKVLFQ